MRRALSLLALLCVACPGPKPDPPPPPSKPEIVPAPPSALGALSAGTDAAPSLASEELAPEPSAPFAPDAGAPKPDAGPGRPPQPDAGMAL